MLRAAFDRQNDQGALQVNVYDTNVGAPLEGASVKIARSIEDGGSDETVGELTSNAAGNCAEIALTAPPEALSYDPESPERPYALYDVTVTREGFEPEVVYGVQVFSGELAIQNVMMKRQGLPGVEAVAITPHTLWGDYPPKAYESEVKQLPEETGFVVLDRVVIPEFIVVHAGVPSDRTATNYYVPYKDYIKNVASSEIYSNWNYETIKANVLAINSLTLNRVFTEWYRSKGYNFTITNSTQYDQYYVHGRTIYESIANAVDEVFMNYVTKPGIRQPLFTQYCDGQKSQCPGRMTQWGSQDLGERGYSAIEILRYYYGSQIYLETAVKVAGIPSSYPGSELRIGASGGNVSKIQTQLNGVAKNYPMIPKLAVTGSYDEATANAVRAFQKIFNIPQTGIVDFGTWYRLSDIYVAVTRMAEL